MTVRIAAAGAGKGVSVRTTIVVLLVMGLISRGATAQQPVVQQPVSTSDDALQKWIAANAIAIRSIDPKDEDFSDWNLWCRRSVPPASCNWVSRATARVPRLRPRHGSSNSCIGVWGLTSSRGNRVSMRCDWRRRHFEVEDPVLAAQRGILTIWSNAAEAKPLFEYVKASQSTTRPIEMVGLDMNVSVRGSMNASRPICAHSSARCAIRRYAAMSRCGLIEPLRHRSACAHTPWRESASGSRRREPGSPPRS